MGRRFRCFDVDKRLWGRCVGHANCNKGDFGLNPFSLVCKSCASRLKVTKLSAIGQSLACPKCGTMLRVQPPHDWVPPPEYHSINETSGALNSFDDVEDLLDRPTKTTTAQEKPSQKQKRPRSKQKHSGKTGPATKSATSDANRKPSTPKAQGSVEPRSPLPINAPAMSKPRPTTSAVSSGEAAVLPGNDWTSETAKKRKQMVLMVAIAIGTVVAVVAIIAAIVVNNGRSNDIDEPDKVAQSQLDEAAADKLKRADAPSKDGEPNSDMKDPQAAEINDEGLLDESPTGSAPIGQNVDPGLDAAPNVAPEAGRFSAPTVVPGRVDGAPLSDPKIALPGATPIVPSGDSFADGDRLDPTPSESGSPIPAAVKTRDQLGDFGSLLALSSSSMDDLQEVALSFERSRNVLTKYFVEPPAPSRLEVDRQSQLPINGIEYSRPVPFSQVVRTLQTLAGIPITIDARQLQLMGQEVDPMVAPKISNTTIAGALAQLVNDRELKPRLTENGILLTSEELPGFVESTIGLPAVSDIDLKQKEQFISSIKTLISPDEWSRDQDPATIELSNDQLVVTCSRNTLLLVQSFVRKLDAAAVLVRDPNNAEAQREVISRWSSTEKLRGLSPELKPGADRGIARFLNHIKKATGLTVLVDWQEAATEGWNVGTTLPGDLVEPTTDQLIKEISMAMFLRPIAIDESTILLTTEKRASSLVDIEVYPISERLANEVEQDSLRELVYKLLGKQVERSFVRVVYEPRCRCLIVVGSQRVQRQVETFVKQVDPKS